MLLTNQTPSVVKITPYLVVSDARAAIAFYETVFGATELFRLNDDRGRIGHAELMLNADRLILIDEFLECGLTSVDATSSAITFQLVVTDASEIYRRALLHGAVSERTLMNTFYGERAGTIRDPFGVRWRISQVLETLTLEEVKQRYAQLTQQRAEADSP